MGQYLFPHRVRMNPFLIHYNNFKGIKSAPQVFHFIDLGFLLFITMLTVFQKSLICDTHKLIFDFRFLNIISKEQG